MKDESGALYFTVGDISCRVVSDGASPRVMPDFLFTNAETPELSASLADRLDDEGLLSSPYQCLLLQTPTEIVLVDTGLGLLSEVAGAPAGRLITALEGVGMTPKDIDVVLLSHAHPDHIGGLLTDGALTFPNARHVMSRTEWDFWTHPDKLARLPEFLAAPARALLPPLDTNDGLDLVADDREVVPGVRLRPAPGHTPGHCVVTISSNGQEATFLADTVLDDLNFTHPDWVSAIDFDPDQTKRTRRQLLEEAATTEAAVVAYHVPGLGHVDRLGANFSFRRA